MKRGWVHQNDNLQDETRMGPPKRQFAFVSSLNSVPGHSASGVGFKVVRAHRNPDELPGECSGSFRRGGEPAGTKWCRENNLKREG